MGNIFSYIICCNLWFETSSNRKIKVVNKQGRRGKKWKKSWREREREKLARADETKDEKSSQARRRKRREEEGRGWCYHQNDYQLSGERKKKLFPFFFFSLPAQQRLLINNLRTDRQTDKQTGGHTSPTKFLQSKKVMPSKSKINYSHETLIVKGNQQYMSFEIFNDDENGEMSGRDCEKGQASSNYRGSEAVLFFVLHPFFLLLLIQSSSRNKPGRNF